MPDSTPPSDLQNLRCEWLWVYEALVPVTETWSKEIVVPAGVFFVLAGKGKIEADGLTTTHPPGTAFFSAPGTRRHWFAEGSRLLSVGFRASWPDGNPLFHQGLNLWVKTTAIKPLHEATRRLYRAIHGTKRSIGYRQAIRPEAQSVVAWTQHEAAYRAWFAEYVKTLAKLQVQPALRPRPSDERINEIMRRLNAWPLAQSLDLEALSTGLSIGPRRLEQLLAASLAITPHSHLNRRRMEAARHLLATTAKPLKEIAHELGLRHASHFTKWFRKHAGLAPSAYRDGGAIEAA